MGCVPTKSLSRAVFRTFSLVTHCQVQLLPMTHSSLSQNNNPTTKGDGTWCMPVFPALKKQRQKDQEFKVSLSYASGSKQAWATRDFSLEVKQKNIHKVYRFLGY